MVERLSLLCGAALFGLWACATPTSSEALVPGALNRAALRASGPRSIAVAAATHVAFDVQTAPGAALFGVVGLGIAAGAADNEAVKLRGPGVEDPAKRIRADILARLARRFGLAITPPADARGDNGAPVASDLTLAVDTSVWGTMATGLAGHYGVKYRGTLRLTDNRTHQVIAQGECTSIPADGEDMPALGELEANDGALLKARIRATAEYCIDDYRKRILGLY